MRHKLNLFKINARFYRKLMAIRWRSLQRQARLQVARRLIHLAFWVSSDASEALEKLSTRVSSNSCTEAASIWTKTTA